MRKLMKTIIYILFVYLIHIGCSRYETLKGTWISAEQDCIKIQDTINKYYNSNIIGTIMGDASKDLFIYGDTLSFQSRFYSSETNYEKLYIERYDLKIISLTKKELKVEPISSLSKEFFHNRKRIVLIKQEFNVDKSINFEKLIYHSTTCYGNCPKIEMEIDSDKNIYLSAEFYKNNTFNQIDSARSGTFSGKVPEPQFNELILLLQTCSLKTLVFPKRMGADAPVTTIIVYFNGEKKHLKSMFPPIISEKLIRHLFELNTKIKLLRTPEKRLLEE